MATAFAGGRWRWRELYSDIDRSPGRRKRSVNDPGAAFVVQKVGALTLVVAMLTTWAAMLAALATVLPALLAAAPRFLSLLIWALSATALLTALLLLVTLMLLPALIWG